MIWRTRDGRALLVSQMTLSHVINAIRLIERSGGRWRSEYLERLKIELIVKRLNDA